MIKFNSDNQLGKVVNSYTTFSEIGNRPISDAKQLMIASGRHKMSRLCGFLFESNVDSNFPQFGIVFICKLRSKLNHQQKKYVDLQWTIPSRWFALSRTSGNSLTVMNKETTLEKYNFDVDKFFNSDLFNKESKNFQKIISKGIRQAKEFAEKIKDPTEMKDAVEEVSSIELSIPLITDTRFEDKNYKLVNYEMKENKKITEASFDQYEWKKGSITGNGLVKIVNDFEKYNSKSDPIRIYNRADNKYYNIVDSHVFKGNSGLVFEIDTAQNATVKEAEDAAAVNKAIDAATKDADEITADQKEISKWLSDHKDDIDNTYEFLKKNCDDKAQKSFEKILKFLSDYSTNKLNEANRSKGKKGPSTGITTVIRGLIKILLTLFKFMSLGIGLSGKLILWITNALAFGADKLNGMLKDCEMQDITEADYREALSHALDPVGVKASTANSIEQDAVEMQIVEKEIDADIEEAMKEIYK